MPQAHAEAVAIAEHEAGLLDTKKRTYPYLGKPVEFIETVLGVTMWSKQREIVEAVVEHRRVGVQSCHEGGKSFILAQIVAYWLSDKVHEPGSAFVVTTAPSAPQVRAILWKEIRRAHGRGNLSGRVNQTEWLMNVAVTGPSGVAVIEEELVAMGRKPSDYDPAAFQGIHARHVLVIIDEADDIPENLYHAATSLTANEGSRIVAIGNPDDPSSYFCRKVLKPGSGWHLIHIDGFQTPNFTDEAIPESLSEELISRVWVEEKRIDYGEGSPLWQSKVRGLVPESGTDGVIPLAWLKRCMVGRDEPWPENDLVPVEFGVDVGAGGDLTVVYERRGRVAGRKWSAHTPDPADALELVLAALGEAPECSAIKLDSIGVGWALCGMLEMAFADMGGAPKICPVNVSTSALNPERFPLLRDQLWWEIGREFCRDAVWDLSSLDETTQAQLIAPQYRHFGGRVKIEKKDDTKKRLGRSPDDADALLLAYYDPPEPPQEGRVIYDDPVTISSH